MLCHLFSNSRRFGKKWNRKWKGKMNQRDVEINTRILVQAQNDAVIVERLKNRIAEIEHFDTFNSMAEVKHELQKILGEQT